MDNSVISAMQAVLQQFSSIKLGYLFGSQATGKVGPLSDVDVAVYLDESKATKRFDIRMQLMAELCKVLKRDDVDVVVLNDVTRPSMKYHVIADGKLFYQVEPFRLVLEPKIIREYFDFRSSLRRHKLTKA